MKPALLALCATLLARPAPAFDVESVDVARANPRYRVALQVRLNVPARSSWATFVNPLNLPQINPAVREVRVMDRRGTQATRLYTRVEICIALVCRRLEQVQDLRYTPRADGGEMQADVIPQLSDFRYGHARWHFRDCDAQTCLSFEAELEPAFWVPPLIGPWLIQRTLHAETIKTSRGLERLAQATAP